MKQPLSPSLYRAFARLAHEQTGIQLASGKEELVAARVTKRMRNLRLQSFAEYRDYLARTPEELEHFVNAITTNLTRFFREEEHFEVLAQALRPLANKRVRIWCAAASTGQEVWTLAMTAAEAMGGGDWRILATDIDTRVLKTAHEGWYSARDCAMLPAQLRDRYMQQRDGGWAFNGTLRHRVHFARVNLAAPPYPMKGPLDVIFCRNVMIYFDKPVRAGIVRQCERLLRPGGLLFLGHSESLNGIETRLRRDSPAVYRMAELARRAA